MLSALGTHFCRPEGLPGGSGGGWGNRVLWSPFSRLSAWQPVLDPFWVVFEFFGPDPLQKVGNGAEQVQKWIRHPPNRGVPCCQPLGPTFVDPETPWPGPVLGPRVDPETRAPAPGGGYGIHFGPWVAPAPPLEGPRAGNLKVGPQNGCESGAGPADRRPGLTLAWKRSALKHFPSRDPHRS